jgi:hypothetical protein
MENSLEIPVKTKKELLYNIVVPQVGIYTKEIKPLCQRGTHTPMFILPIIVKV